MIWIATEGYGLYPAPETLGFVPMLGTPTETRICSPTWLCGGWMKLLTGGSGAPPRARRVAAISRRRWFPCGLAFSGVLSLNYGETVDLKAGAQETPDLWLIIDQEN